MCGVNQAPATIDRDMIEQPLQRPLAAPGEAFLDFPDLFGDVDMDRAGAIELQQCGQLFQRYRPQRVRGDPDHCARLRCHGPAARFQQPCKAVEVVDETTLARFGRPTAETGMGVEHRQQGQADTARLCRCRNPLGQFGRIGITRARDVMMEIVKFADPGKTRFQHLDIGLRRHRLDIVGGHAADKAIHQFAPAPETVGGVSPDFGQAGHAALKSMAVQIGHAREPDAVTLVTGRCARTGFDAGEPPRSSVTLTSRDQPCGSSACSKNSPLTPLSRPPRETLDSIGAG